MHIPFILSSHIIETFIFPKVSKLKKDISENVQKHLMTKGFSPNQQTCQNYIFSNIHLSYYMMKTINHFLGGKNITNRAIKGTISRDEIDKISLEISDKIIQELKEREEFLKTEEGKLAKQKEITTYKIKTALGLSSFYIFTYIMFSRRTPVKSAAYLRYPSLVRVLIDDLYNREVKYLPFRDNKTLAVTKFLSMYTDYATGVLAYRKVHNIIVNNTDDEPPSSTIGQTDIQEIITQSIQAVGIYREVLPLSQVTTEQISAILNSEENVTPQQISPEKFPPLPCTCIVSLGYLPSRMNHTILPQNILTSAIICTTIDEELEP